MHIPAELSSLRANRTHWCVQSIRCPDYHVSVLSCSSGVVVLFPTLCWNLYSVRYTLHHHKCSKKYAKPSNVITMSLLHAGPFVGSINVFDFAPGGHTATITVNNTLGNSDSESFNFFTPGQYIGTMVPRA